MKVKKINFRVEIHKMYRLSRLELHMIYVDYKMHYYSHFPASFAPSDLEMMH